MRAAIGADVLYVTRDAAHVRPAKIVAVSEEWSVSSASDPRFNAKGVGAIGASERAIKLAIQAAQAKASSLSPPVDLKTDVHVSDEAELVVFVAGELDRGLVEHHERQSSSHHPCVVSRRARYSENGEPHTWHWDVPVVEPAPAAPPAPTADAAPPAPPKGPSVVHPTSEA